MAVEKTPDKLTPQNQSIWQREQKKVLSDIPSQLINLVNTPHLLM